MAMNDWPVIDRYTRTQAIEDGVLVDVTAIAREAGFSVPVAVTVALWGLIEPNEAEQGRGQDAQGRLWDVLSLARLAIVRRPETDDPERLLYTCLFDCRKRPGVRDGIRPRRLKVHSGPGDRGEHVLTIMLPEED